MGRSVSGKETGFKNGMNDITKKWTPTGLLEGLTDTQIDECALMLEELAQFLVKNSPKQSDDKTEWKKNEELCRFVLPIARALYVEIYPKKFPDVKWLVEDFQKFLNEKRDLLNDLKESSSSSYMALDEFSCLYRKDCVSRL